MPAAFKITVEYRLDENGFTATVLNDEIKTNYRGEKIKTIYIGGGTPSSLSIDELQTLFDIINQFPNIIYSVIRRGINLNNIWTLFKRKTSSTISICLTINNVFTINSLSKNFRRTCFSSSTRSSK